MPLSPENKRRRNLHVKERFRYYRKKNPKWNIIYIIDEVAKEVFLSHDMVSKILKQNDEDVPCKDTVTKHCRQLQLSIF